MYFQCMSRTIILINRLIIAYISSSIFTLCLAIPLVVFKPHGVVLLRQLIPQKYFYFPVACLVILDHDYLMTSVTLGGLVVGCVAFLLCFYLMIPIRELCIGRRHYESGHILREADQVAHVHRCLQVFYNNVICLFGPYLAALNEIMMLSAIYVNFLLIPYWASLEQLTKATMIWINFIVVTAYCLLLQLGCIFSVQASQTLCSWRRHKWSDSCQECRIMKAFQRSCRPILLRWENYFVLGRLSIIVHGRGVVRGTVRALLTTK